MFGTQIKNYGHPIVRFKAGMPLYHVTYRRVPLDETNVLHELYGDNKINTYKNLPIGGLLLNPDQPIYFGLTPEFPYYYGANDIEKVALEFRLKTNVVLIDISNKGTYTHPKTHAGMEPYTGLSYFDFEQLIFQEKEVDGWIGIDDPYDYWREILILDPINKLDFSGYRILNRADTECRIGACDNYIWCDKEIFFININ